MADHPHKFPPPKKAKGTRRQITTKHQPGGPHTPGAKAEAAKQNAKARKPGSDTPFLPTK